MEKRDNRKTLGMKISKEFYDEIVKCAHEHYMTITTLIKTALYETYGLREDKEG